MKRIKKYIVTRFGTREDFVEMNKALWLFYSIMFFKRYLNIETRAYKRWWEERCKEIQRQLDIQNGKLIVF